ncbi:MAG: type IX secretion system membrane protein PorP/SprF [Cytophagales bacterium]|nr:type IX secretion system membrane protein PorP/SprF [Cytophagales bacterium]
MKKLLFGISFLLAVVFQVSAQQKAQFTQYMTNSYLINPALAGTEDFVDLKAGFRQQWAGFSGAPQTMYLSGHSPIGELHEYYHYKGERTNWHGAGGMIMKDEAGAISQTSFLASYSYNLGLTGGSGFGRNRKAGIRASFALSFGVQQYRIDASKFTSGVKGEAQAVADANYVGEDPVLAGINSDQATTTPDANLGTWIYNDDFYVGLSLQQLLGTRVDLEGTTDLTRLNRHYIITGGYRIPISYQDIAFVPSVLVKGVEGAPVSVDINGKFDFFHQYWVGLSYRHGDAMAILLGAVIARHYEIAYSFDFTTTDIQDYTPYGTHEITIGYRLLPRAKLHNAEDHWTKKSVHR